MTGSEAAPRVAATPGPAATCRAPSVAMQLSIAGTVNACCQNGDNRYGTVPIQTLTEIWEGEPRRRMARALAAGDYPPGCELCQVEHALGNRRSTPAQGFDRFPDGPHEWPRQMEFTLSNRCNLACVQCNGENSSTIRAKREHLPPLPKPYGEEFFVQLPPFLEHLEVAAFLGGEPFLAPEARRVWDMLLERGLSPEVQVTTNATVWNDNVARYVDDLRMHLAVSIDGATKETYEAIRVGATYERVIEIRDRMLAATRRHGSHFQLNYCLLPANWHELGRFLAQADALDVAANVIPVFDPAEHSVFALPAAELAQVVGELEAEDAQLAPRLGRNRAAWDAALEMLRSERDRVAADWSRDTALAAIREAQWERFRSSWTDEAAGVPVGLPARARRDEDPRVAEAQASLAAWSGTDSVDVLVAVGRVREVRVPPWAEPLDPQQWVGLELAAITDAVSARLGPIDLGRPVDVGPGATQTDSVVAGPAGPIRFRAVHLEFPGSLGRLLLTTPDPLDMPVGSRRR